MSGLETIISIARFCTHSSAEVDDYNIRSIKLKGKDGKETRLLKTPLNNPHALLFAFRLSIHIEMIISNFPHNLNFLNSKYNLLDETY